jgi:YggT family protein
MGAINQALLFIIAVVFNLYIWAVMLRLILSWLRTDYFNPLSQLVLKLTNFVVTPLKKFIPNMNGIETACFVWLLIVIAVKIILTAFLMGFLPGVVSLIIWMLAELISQVLNLYFYLIIIVALASWFTRGGQHPVIAVLQKITDPILSRIRQLIPAIAGFDFSPVIAIILIKVIEILVTAPLYHLLGR